MRSLTTAIRSFRNASFGDFVIVCTYKNLTLTTCIDPLGPATTIRTCTATQRKIQLRRLAPTLGIGVGI